MVSNSKVNNALILNVSCLFVQRVSRCHQLFKDVRGLSAVNIKTLKLTNGLMTVLPHGKGRVGALVTSNHSLIRFKQEIYTASHVFKLLYIIL